MAFIFHVTRTVSHMYNLEQVTLPFIFKREVKTIDPIMQNNFLVLIKKKKKRLYKEMFHLIEISLISKEEDD